MIDINDAHKILASDKCGDLFSNNADKAKEEFRALVKLYHPDRNKDSIAEEVFQKINELYNKAVKMLEDGIWEESNSIRFIEKATGIGRTLNFLKECNFELGVQYISSTKMTYVLDEKNKKYYDNCLDRISKLRYDNTEMEKEFSKYFPKLVANFQTTDGKYVIVMEKTSDVFRLRDILDYYKGEMPDRHVAWIMSRLCNISCYLNHIGVSHNGISLENCFISPQYHSVLVLGGWWYCVDQDEKMIGTQKQIYDMMSPIAKTNKIGSIVTDLESIKLIGRTLLGKAKVPDDFNKWVNSGSSKSPSKEYEKWDKALTGAYGARKFVKMEIEEKDIYDKV